MIDTFLNPMEDAQRRAIREICGGVPRTGGGGAWDFGFRASSPEDWRAAGLLTAADPEEDDGIYLKGDRVILTDYAKAANRGRMPLFNWQLTGSCVNGGGQNAVTVRTGVECCLLPAQFERFVLPFTLMAYGQSRFDAYRETQEGDGSSGAYFAKSLGQGLVLPVDFPGLPTMHECGPALVYDRSVELAYSAIKNHPAALRTAARPYTLRYREVRTADEGVEQIRRGRPITFAGDWGGLDRPPLKNGLLLSQHATEWQHQQCVVAFWFHPVLGLIFLVINQWYYPDPDGTMKVRYIRVGRGQSIDKILVAGNALSMHGKPPLLEDGTELPACSYWILAKDFEYQARTGEVRSLYSMAGFPGAVAPLA